MTTDELEIEVNDELVEVVVSYNISGRYTPARTSGPPEKCYPAEYPEVEVVSITDRKGNSYDPETVWPTESDRCSWERLVIEREEDRDSHHCSEKQWEDRVARAEDAYDRLQNR